MKITYEPLLQRAGGYEYGPSPIETDKKSIDSVENKAIEEFRNNLAEETEGSMELLGEPHILPYDYLYVIPTCNDKYTAANASALTWEVNGIKHTRKAGERYTTEVGASIGIFDRYIEVESKYREA